VTTEMELTTIPERALEIGKRRLQILRLLSRGWTNEEIAKEIHVSLATVKRHIHDLKKNKKFKARNATHLVAIAYEKGILGEKKEDAGSKER
jgi:DNA-binding NarL/FixJ family response regulator